MSSSSTGQQRNIFPKNHQMSHRDQTPLPHPPVVQNTRDVGHTVPQAPRPSAHLIPSCNPCRQSRPGIGTVPVHGCSLVEQPVLVGEPAGWRPDWPMRVRSAGCRPKMGWIELLRHRAYATFLNFLLRMSRYMNERQIHCTHIYKHS